MGKERTVITQQLCDHVKALLAGRLTISQAAKFANVGEATVGRIKAAGFDAEQYEKNKAARKEEKKAKKPLIIGNYIDTGTTEWTPPTAEQLAKAMAPGAGMDQVLGQLEMQLTQPEEEKHEETETWLAALYNQQERIIEKTGKIIEKLDSIFIGMEGIHRYIAGKTDLLSKTLGTMMEKMDKQTDYLGQMLRRTDK